MSDTREAFSTVLKRRESSPPSPVLDFPPRRFIAMAMVVCASQEMEPKLMAPLANLLTMVSTLSTSSSGTAVPLVKSRSPRRVMGAVAWSSMSRVYSLKTFQSFFQVACWSLWMVSGLSMWRSPRWRHWYCPPTSMSSS